MKTPITYYGGKTNMLRHILPLLNKEHNIYVEPFIGGGFAFAKSPIAKNTNTKKINFTAEIAQRLENCQIFNRDALDVIERFDSEKVNGS